MAIINDVGRFKEDKNFKFRNPICTYEILGKTPLDERLGRCKMDGI